MCFEFSSCFGGGRDDYGGERSNRNRNEAGGHSRGHRGNNNRNGYYVGADHKAPQRTYQQPPAAVDEAGHKAYHDHAAAGARGGYTAYTQAQHKADIETPKLPAWHNKVSDEAYTARLQEAAADHRYNAATDYHHYPTIALGRY
ncbi:hypothetical protein CFC21_045636 [Triticum aestivum]|uniref:Uncharacterized protein n=2 Tax=Triticum aestivum TaxID=4565 RepID=A0A9R1FUD6_WHEAT|nr:hypothetical protein CFC21_045636 [Triticum aestivum]